MNTLMERTFLPLCWFMFSWWEFAITSGTKSLVSYRFILCENCALKSRVGVARICSVEFSAVLMELHCVGNVWTYSCCCCGVQLLLPWRFIKLPEHYFPEFHCANICGWYDGRIVVVIFFLSFAICLASAFSWSFRFGSAVIVWPDCLMLVCKLIRDFWMVSTAC